MDGLVAKLLREQLGLITLKQAMAAGLSEGAVRHRVDSKRWQRVGHGVYSVGDQPMSPVRRVLAAIMRLGAPSAAAGRTAAWFWHLDGFATAPKVLEVARPTGARLAMPGIRVVQMRGLGPESTVQVGKVPVCGMPLTLIQLAATEKEERLEMALDSAARQHPRIHEATVAELNRIGARGRDGCERLRRLLELRVPVRDSELEVRVHQLCRQAGVPPPKVQHQIIEAGRRIVKADFAWPDVKLAILAQGRRFHSGHQSFEKDNRQVSDLSSFGWLVLLPTWHRITREPADFVAQLRQTHAEASLRWNCLP